MTYWRSCFTAFALALAILAAPVAGQAQSFGSIAEINEQTSELRAVLNQIRADRTNPNWQAEADAVVEQMAALRWEAHLMRRQAVIEQRQRIFQQRIAAAQASNDSGALAAAQAGLSGAQSAFEALEQSRSNSRFARPVSPN